MPATLADVARSAGVSEATASRVINGRRHVAAATRDRVQAAADTLDYVPNRAARDLSLSRTATVALLVHHRQYPAAGEGTFGSRVLDGAAAALRARGHDLIYATLDDDAVLGMHRLPLLRHGRTDGALLLGPAFPAAAITTWRSAGRPTVLIDNLHDGLDAVLSDNRDPVRQLTQHLYDDHGYRAIGCIAGPVDWLSTAERVDGYREAMAVAGAEARIVHAPQTTIRDGAAAIGELRRGGALEAVVAVNDAMALGALHATRGDPAAPAVVGFDDIAWAALAEPPLTTVAVNSWEMGALAAELLLERIADPTAPPRTARIAATIRIRRSCGCEAATAQPDDHRSSSSLGHDHGATSAPRGEGPPHV